MALLASAMELSERPRGQNQQDQLNQVTTQRPEVTTEDTANRILSLPVEDKCAKRKLSHKIRYYFKTFGKIKGEVRCVSIVID